MSETAASKLWEDVSEGDRLPDLELPITFRTGILAVVGMRDFNPVHHYTDYATRTSGNRDSWMNTMWHQGLFARFRHGLARPRQRLPQHLAAHDRLHPPR